MGTHPIFESDFDCLTDLLKMEAADRMLCQKLNNLDLLPPAKKLYDLTDNDVIRIIYSILNFRENDKNDIQTPKSTLARFKLVTRLANQIDELGYYSVINYETFLTPDFSPQGSTRNVILYACWLGVRAGPGLVFLWLSPSPPFSLF